MKKHTAIAAFGSIRAIAKALEVSTQAIYDWPDPLTLTLRDRVVGACVRLGRPIPSESSPKVKGAKC